MKTRVSDMPNSLLSNKLSKPILPPFSLKPIST